MMVRSVSAAAEGGAELHAADGLVARRASRARESMRALERGDGVGARGGERLGLGDRAVRATTAGGRAHADTG